MITKGIVKEVLNNKLMVRLPIFESAGVNSNFIVECTINYTPGNINSYRENDVVYVGFEDNQINNPIVLGKLYLGKEEVASNYSFNNSLEVTNAAILPIDTTIGDVHLKDIIENIKEAELINETLNQKQNKLKAGTNISFTFDAGGNQIINATGGGGGSGNVDDVTFNGASVVENKVAVIPYDLSNYNNNVGFLTEHQSLSGYAKLDVSNTFTKGQKITRTDSGAILELESAAGDTNFLLTRTGGSQCVLESGASIGLFGTKSNHPLQVGTNYTCRMTFGTDGSVTLATDVAANSNSNQLATTKWVVSKGYLTEHQSLADYATKSYVEGMTWLPDEWQNLPTILFDEDSGVLPTMQGAISSLSTQVNTINEELTEELLSLPEVLFDENNGYIPVIQGAISSLNTQVSELDGYGKINIIDTQTIKIWSLTDGLYELTYPGSKILNYSAGNQTINSTGVVLLQVQSTTGTRKIFQCENDYQSLVYGYVDSESVGGCYSLAKLHGVSTCNGGTLKNIYAPESVGTSGQVLTSSGSGAPTWQTPTSGVTSVVAGQGLSGGTITSTGTISIDDSYINTLIATYLGTNLDNAEEGSY